MKEFECRYYGLCGLTSRFTCDGKNNTCVAYEPFVQAFLDLSRIERKLESIDSTIEEINEMLKKLYANTEN